MAASLAQIATPVLFVLQISSLIKLLSSVLRDVVMEKDIMLNVMMVIITPMMDAVFLAILRMDLHAVADLLILLIIVLFIRQHR